MDDKEWRILFEDITEHEDEKIKQQIRRVEPERSAGTEFDQFETLIDFNE